LLGGDGGGLETSVTSSHFVPSFPAGFLTESPLRGAAGWAGRSYENKIHKVREKQSRNDDATSAFKDRVTKEIAQGGPSQGRTRPLRLSLPH
jgi:hypothetical protein